MAEKSKRRSELKCATAFCCLIAIIPVSHALNAAEVGLFSHSCKSTLDLDETHELVGVACHIAVFSYCRIGMASRQDADPLKKPRPSIVRHSGSNMIGNQPCH
jgi:hypothetical protein